MPASIFCSLDAITVVSGGSLAGQVVILTEEPTNNGLCADDAPPPNVYFRLIGVEIFRMFQSDKGPQRRIKIFLDTVFTLHEAMRDYKHNNQEGSIFSARFRFQLPKNLPTSFSLGDHLPGDEQPSSSSSSSSSFSSHHRTIWIDSSSGVHYVLIASLEPVSHELIRKLEQGQLSNSKSKSSSMDLYTALPIDPAGSLLASVATTTETSLRLHIDAFLEDALLHRGPVVQTASKNIAGAGFFPSTQPVIFTVTADQYVVLLGSAFPVLISLNNMSARPVEHISSKLVGTLAYNLLPSGPKGEMEYLACAGPNLDVVVPPGGQVDDLMFWIKLSEDLKLPSSNDTFFVKVTYDLVMTAHFASGQTVEVRLPLFLSRGTQLTPMEAIPQDPLLPSTTTPSDQPDRHIGVQPS